MSDKEFDREAVLKTEYSPEFDEGRKVRMIVSYFRYGLLSEAYPHRINAIESLKQRLDKYAETGNKEFLMDAANFAMIEFMHPAHPNAFFEATDSDQSPGRVGRVSLGRTSITKAANKDVMIDPDLISSSQAQKARPED